MFKVKDRWYSFPLKKKNHNVGQYSLDFEGSKVSIWECLTIQFSGWPEKLAVLNSGQSKRKLSSWSKPQCRQQCHLALWHCGFTGALVYSRWPECSAEPAKNFYRFLYQRNPQDSVARSWFLCKLCFFFWEIALGLLLDPSNYYNYRRSSRYNVIGTVVSASMF